MSVTCAIFNIERWGINLHGNTLFIFVYGTILFLVVSIGTQQYYSRKYRKLRTVSIGIGHITIPKWKIAIVIVFDVIVLCLIYYSISRIASDFNKYSGFSDMVYNFRYYTAYNAEIQTPMWINQLAKILDCSAYIFLYIFINNILSHKAKLKYNLCLLLPVFPTIFKSFMYGARVEFLNIIAAAVILYYILWNRKYHWRKSVNIKFILKLFFLSIMTLVLFYTFLSIVGRKTDIGFFNYITNYIGASIHLFDIFMQYTTIDNSEWGSETFRSIHNLLAKLKLFGFSHLSSAHLEFQYYNNINLGNVYTAYRGWIHDFGLIGMSILQVILALFYNVFYQRLRWKTKTIKNNSNLIIYAYLINKLFLHSINSTFFSTLASLNFILIIVLFKFLYSILVKKKRQCKKCYIVGYERSV